MEDLRDRLADPDLREHVERGGVDALDVGHGERPVRAAGVARARPPPGLPPPRAAPARVPRLGGRAVVPGPADLILG